MHIYKPSNKSTVNKLAEKLIWHFNSKCFIKMAQLEADKLKLENLNNGLFSDILLLFIATIVSTIWKTIFSY